MSISKAGTSKMVSAEEIDMTARFLSMGKVHHAMTGTGGVGLAVAASIEVTIVQQGAGSAALDGCTLKIGQPSGIRPIAATTCRLLLVIGWLKKSP